MPEIDEQYEQCRQWRDWFTAAGYKVYFSYTTDQPAPFDREWTVYDGGTGRRVGQFDIDGCGASWHGPDALWLDVIGPHVGVTR